MPPESPKSKGPVVQRTLQEKSPAQRDADVFQGMLHWARTNGFPIYELRVGMIQAKLYAPAAAIPPDAEKPAGDHKDGDDTQTGEPSDDDLDFGPARG